MLKHVSSGQLRRRSADMGSTGTLGSTGSAGSADTSSPGCSPPSSVRSEPLQRTARKPPVFTGVIKVYTSAVRSDIEYKTFIISSDTSSKDLVNMMLFKCKMRNRDPNLFYITMEIGIKKKGVPVRSMMILEDEAKPLVLQACHPRGESRFHLQQKRGGLVKVNVACLSPGSQYKTLYISDRTSSVDLIKLLLTSYKVADDSKHYALHEVCTTDTGDYIYERQLSQEDCPLLIQQSWTNPRDFAFHIKRLSVSVAAFQRYRRQRRVQSADITDLYINQLKSLDMSTLSNTSSMCRPPLTSMRRPLLSSTTSLSASPTASLAASPLSKPASSVMSLVQQPVSSLTNTKSLLQPASSLTNAKSLLQPASSLAQPQSSTANPTSSISTQTVSSSSSLLAMPVSSLSSSSSPIQAVNYSIIGSTPRKIAIISSNNADAATTATVMGRGVGESTSNKKTTNTNESITNVQKAYSFLNLNRNSCIYV